MPNRSGTVIILFISVIVLFFAINLRIALKTKKHPDADLNVVQLIQKYNYPIELHRITTEDGYILTLHRIPGSPNEQTISTNNSTQKIPVFLMHGFMHSAVEFVNLGPKKALALLLADRGFDVWLGNARGTTWSREHLYFNPDRDAQYWEFSFHEIGIYDVAASLTYIGNVSGVKEVHYVGYSQGTSAFFAMAAKRPEFLKRVRLMTALAPAVFIGNPHSPLLKVLVYLKNVIKLASSLFGVYEVFADKGFPSFYLKTICDENSIFVELCLHHFFILHGYNYEYTDKSKLSLIISNLPAGVSAMQMHHLIQIIESENFELYDWGVEENFKKYGQNDPPPYNLSSITTPVALYYSRNDWMVHIENIDLMASIIPNVVKKFLVPMKKFNHDDFVHGKNVAELVYKDLLNELEKY